MEHIVAKQLSVVGRLQVTSAWAVMDTLAVPAGWECEGQVRKGPVTQ